MHFRWMSWLNAVKNSLFSADDTRKYVEWSWYNDTSDTSGQFYVLFFWIQLLLIWWFPSVCKRSPFFKILCKNSYFIDENNKNELKNGELTLIYTRLLFGKISFADKLVSKDKSENINSDWDMRLPSFPQIYDFFFGKLEASRIMLP